MVLVEELVLAALLVDRSLINKLPAVIFLTASPHQHSKPCGGFEQSNKSPVAVEVEVTMVNFVISGKHWNIFPRTFKWVSYFPHFPFPLGNAVMLPGILKIVSGLSSLETPSVLMDYMQN